MVGESYDLIVIGAGPAGLAGALYGGRAELNTLVRDRGLLGGQLIDTDGIEEYPGIERIEGRELAERMVGHARRFGAEIRSEGVAKVIPSERGFIVQTDDAKTYRAKAVIVAAGGEPKRLAVPGEERFRGRGVSNCALCDGPFFGGKVVAVVGGGNSAAQESVVLTRYATKVYLVVRGNRLKLEPNLGREVERQPAIEVMTETVVEEFGGEQRVEWLRLCDPRSGEPRRLDVAGVFISIGFAPRTEVFPPGIRIDRQGFVITDERMQTSLPGLFVAGDIHAHPVRQITNATGDATTAAIAAYEHIARAAASDAPVPDHARSRNELGDGAADAEEHRAWRSTGSG